jgi:hypothetical protein
MEMSELQYLWQEYNKKISETTSLNKEILRHILLEKPQRSFRWIKIKAGLRIFSPLLFVLLVMILKVQFNISTRFYIGLGLFLPVFIITYFWDVKYYMLLRGVDFSMPVLSIKKITAELEKYKIKTTKIRYLLMPLAMLGFLLMIIHKIPLNFSFLSVIPLLLIVLVFFSSMYITFKYSINERFKKLNKDISEIDKLEKD